MKSKIYFNGSNYFISEDAYSNRFNLLENFFPETYQELEDRLTTLRREFYALCNPNLSKLQ